MKTTYTIRYITKGCEDYQLVNGAFRIKENAIAKIREMIQDPAVERVILRKRTGWKTERVYVWNGGFEIIYPMR